MHVLALVNQKGGCGKTTTAVNLAGALAASGERALLVDLDPQAHATLALGCAIEDEPSLVDVLLEHVTLREAIESAPGGLWLAPATTRLSEFEDAAARTIRPEHALDRALAPCALSFDWVILDCPPRADGVLTANALRAADTAVLVVETGTFSLQGALKALAVLEDLSETLEHPFVLRAVATLFDRRVRIAREVLVGMQAQLGPALFDTAIRTSVRLREAAAAGAPVSVLDPRCRAADDFRCLAEEVRAHAAAHPGRRAATDRWLAPAPRRKGPSRTPSRAERRLSL